MHGVGGDRRSEPDRRAVVPAKQREPGEVMHPDHLREQYSFEPGYGEERDEEGSRNLLRYLGILAKHRWLVLGITAVVFLGGMLLTFLTTPIYQTTATLQIDREAAKIVDVEGVQSVETNDQGFYPTQYELLRSRSLASRVVTNLALTEDSEFLQAGIPAAWEKLRDLLFDAPAGGSDSDVEVPQMVETLSPPAQAPPDGSAISVDESDLYSRFLTVSDQVMRGVATGWQALGYFVHEATADEAGQGVEDLSFEERRQIAVGRVLDGLSVQPVGTSRLVRVAFESPDPRVAAQIANAVAEGFINTNLERRYAASAYARKFLEERLQEIKLKLEDSERQLVDYARDQRLVSVTQSAESLAGSNLGSARQALAEATTDRIRAEQLWRQASATGGLGLGKIIESGSVEVLRTERARMSAEYQQKLSTFKPAYPDMLNLKARLEEVDRQIAAEASLIKSSVRADYEAALAKEVALKSNLEELKGDVLDFEGRNIQYKILRREVDTNTTLYEGLLQRYKEIGVAGGVGTNNVAIVDRALVPGMPFKPNLSKNLALALGLGLFLGVSAAFCANFFDDALKSAEEIESLLGVPVLGVMPLVTAPNVAQQVLENPRSALAEAFRSLRTALQFSTAAGAPKSLLVTSPRAAEGKSTISVSIARSFAQVGLRVLLIDADLRDPSLQREMQRAGAPYLVPTKGLTNYLAGSATPPEVFQVTEMENLTFLPTGPLPPNPAELLAGPKMPSLLRTAEEQFDIVIIDGPPVMGLADAPLLASVASETLLVLAAGQSRREVARLALKRLQFARARILGVALNKFDHRKVGFSYGYGTGYGYGYGEDYSYGKASPRSLPRGDSA